jgi:branched-subunit amino acid aminotransferase/4-amino-4-deoxychorismate lyase
VGQGEAVARRGRGIGARLTLLAAAVLGRGLVDPEAPLFAADDEALLRGSAAFETLPVYGGRPFRLEPHIERLRFSAQKLGLPPVGDAGELVLLVAGAVPDCVLRLYRTEHDLVATAAAFPRDLEEIRQRGLAVQTVELGSPSELLAGVKSTSYAFAFTARRAAAASGADDVIFTGNGRVLEAATANVWWRVGDMLFTPATGAGVLPGVTREAVRELARDLAYDVEEGAYPLADLVGAEEAFETSSIREVVPVVSIDGTTVGDGRGGPAATRLQAALRLLSRP